MGKTCTLRPCLQVEPSEFPVRGELPEPLQGRSLPNPPCGRALRALVEAPVPLDQLREGPTARHPVELLPIDPVAPLDLPVQVWAPEPDAAVISFLNDHAEGRFYARTSAVLFPPLSWQRLAR